MLSVDYLRRSIVTMAVALVTIALLNGHDISAQEINLEDRLFEQLQTATPEMSGQIEKQILDLWSDSGSPALNLLLQRGRRAMITKNYQAAVNDFTMLTELAPDFAEGWNARATAWYLMQQYELSVTDIAATLQLNGRHFGALNGLALIMEKYGENSAALKVYLDIQRLHPNRDGLAEAIGRLQRKLTAQSI